MATASVEIIDAPDGSQLLGAFAETFECGIRAFVLQNGERVDARPASEEGGAHRVSVAGGQWSCQYHVLPLENGMFEIKSTFKLLGEAPAEAVAGLSFTFEGWQNVNHVFMPAAVYQGNRFEVRPMPYPPLWQGLTDFREDPPITTTDLPRLTEDQPVLELGTGDLSTPCMGFYDPIQKRGVLIFTDQGTRFGNSGMRVEHLKADVQTQFSVTAPSLRQSRHSINGSVPSGDHPTFWRQGDKVTLRTLVSFFQSDELAGFYEHFCELRKEPNSCNHMSCLPFSAARRMIEEKYNRENWEEACGYYRMAPDSHTTFATAENPLCFLWQLGWVGGGQATLPLLSEGDETSRHRAWQNLEMIFGRTQAKSGWFYGIGDGNSFFGDGFDRPWPEQMHLVRKSADWLYFSVKHFDLIEKQRRSVPPEWDHAIERLADAFVELWKVHGQFGQIVDVESGKLLVGGSCAGGIAPAGLVRAAERYKQPCYLEVAMAAGRHYREEYVRKGISNGGPGEILSAPDSESVFALMESFAALMEVDDDPYWTEAARETLRLAATWVVSYDYQFPAQSDLARVGARTTGAVWANVQNKHAAPGICTLSGEGLLRYWRRTGDALALDLLHDIANGMPQYLSREDRPLNERMRPGWMCERVNMSDWEGSDGIGGRLFGSCWPEVSMMLTAIEIPGIYLQPDAGLVVVFDHLISSKIVRTEGRLQFRLTNPTAFDAEVLVLSESATARSIPLGLNPLYSSPRLRVPAGETIDVEFSS